MSRLYNQVFPLRNLVCGLKRLSEPLGAVRNYSTSHDTLGVSYVLFTKETALKSHKDNPAESTM